jgi:hypothetical protein
MHAIVTYSTPLPATCEAIVALIYRDELVWTGLAPTLADPAEVLEGPAGKFQFQFVEGTVDES